jgi:predicted Zn-ribbon and HTH transcriptional regulator
VIGAAILIVAAILLMSVGFTVVEFRKMTPLVFECLRCGHEFRQAPHLDFPSECPSCHAPDWNSKAPG